MRNKKKVLIIDDSKISRLLIAKYLDDSYECCMADNGEEGWQILLEETSITLIFAAMDMPVLNGILLLERIRMSECERITNTPVIIITGYQDSETAKRASYAAGATDFISKPFIKSEIRSCARTFTIESVADNTAETDVSRNVLRELDENKQLAELGNNAISSAASNNDHASIMYIKIVNLDKLNDKYDGKIMNKLTDKVSALLEAHSRDEENVFIIGSGKYVITLPKTSAFKANIAANRLQLAIEKLSYQSANGTVRLRLAIGITSTESCDEVTEFLSFSEYCIEAQYALNMSMESKNNNVVRFDETYEKNIQSDYMQKDFPYRKQNSLKGDGGIKF
jgi:diguanylate cyclase (GGDEF)-like protein